VSEADLLLSLPLGEWWQLAAAQLGPLAALLQLALALDQTEAVDLFPKPPDWPDEGDEKAEKFLRGQCKGQYNRDVGSPLTRRNKT